jgi:error-prone DNA polymerase
VVHLHVRSWFSFLAGGSSPTALVRAAAALGHRAIALTDLHGVYGAVRFATAAREAGIKPIFGATLMLEHAPEVRCPLVLIARTQDGYARLCNLITAAHRTAPRPTSSARAPAPHRADECTDPRDGPDADVNRRLDPHLPVEEFASFPTDDLLCLTGGPEGRLASLLRDRQPIHAARWLQFLADRFADRLYVELVHRRQPGDALLVTRLADLAHEHGVPLVVSNAVRYAAPGDFPRYDALTCVRLGVTVADRHPGRPVNDEAWLKPEAELRALLPYPEAFTNTERIAEQATMDLLPGEVTPPGALLPPGTSPSTYLWGLCAEGIQHRYRPDERTAAWKQLEHEMAVVSDLDLCEFFLVVHEVTRFARSRGIRYAGRGSAANSIIAYCLRITNVDPIRHKLLFERFLHRGRKGMPDIDVDFDSERRPEVIEWMEDRFGIEHTAMTANVNTYRAKMAMREMMKVLGWDLDTIGRVSRVIGHHDGMSTIEERRPEVEAITGPSPLLDVLFKLVVGLRNCPRHLGLHNGGMILSRTPLALHTPVQTSANGVRQVQFDKDDVEALGLIKFDVLGLRSLAVVSEALLLHELDGGRALPIDDMPLDDEATFELIRSGRTMSVFQIESPGQWNLLSRTQPKNFDDLVAEVALFRPGPLQGGMVNPYVERKAGREETSYLHPSLASILHDTCGIILFQEQVLEVSHQFAGMSLEEADKFRSLMSKWRDPGDMASMRERFVAGAISRHRVDPALAHKVFDQVAAFVGYGFCRSHAAAFAQIVYQTAWLKTHHGAAFMAAVLQHKPGFYPMSTVLEECKHMGIAILPVDIWKSGARYRVEGGAIRIPLTQVKGMSESMAEAFVRARAGCRTVEELRRAVPLAVDVWDALARAGAIDRDRRRESLWHLGLMRDVSPDEEVRQLELFELSESAELFPHLPDLGERGTVRWDLETMDLTPGRHPVALYREALEARRVAPIQTLFKTAPGRKLRIGGVVVTFQRPPTANGMTFIVLEDETGRLPVAVMPALYERHRKTLRAGALVFEGRVQQAGPTYRSLLASEIWTFDEQLRQ